jgi:hypothetical protein
MGVLVSTNVATLHVVFVFAFLIGVANAPEIPLRPSFVSELVERPCCPTGWG